VDISFLKDLLDSSLLNDNEEIPEGDYREENMKSTVVPSRNLIFSSIAIGY
jgi:7-cyano-7-deazaguanine synthase